MAGFLSLRFLRDAIRSTQLKSAPRALARSGTMAPASMSRRRYNSSIHAPPDTSHSIEARKALRTHGLVPPVVESYELQAQRCMKQLNAKASNIEKYNYLSHLRNSNVHLFYRLVLDNFTTLTPLIYTPVVGEACLKWSEIYRQPEGMYLSYSDRGNLKEILQNWPKPNVELTVVTDGSRILGLGDLGINGMGIPVGKLALYTGCAGIRPEVSLPLTLDLGTNNEGLLNDPLYMGTRMKRVSEEEEGKFLDELMVALNEVWPGIVVQFEDFKNPFPALEKYQHKYSCFNDDIQGTGAVVLAGIISALKSSGLKAKDQRAVFMGAGSAGTGVAKQIVEYYMKEGLSEDEARKAFWFVDTKGMITNDRGDKLAEHKKYFARDDNNGLQLKSLPEIVDYVKPTILMGLSTIRGIFDEPLLNKMAKLNKNPIIFPLSNPSSNAECTFEEAVKYTDGRALFASGSPFQDYVYKGKVMKPSQGNNMYVFPGIGLAAILSKAKHISQEMIYASATALSSTLLPEEFASGMLYPSLDRIREVSVIVARDVIRTAQREKLDREPVLRDMNDAQLEAWIKERMYDPRKEDGYLELMRERNEELKREVEIASFEVREKLSAKL
ncbi:NAD(P)-binding Rossmann-fold containing protein [Glarea lozoyensis ATCC 20868]|uniref:Malic enzyme n=1 Tax=Glarea lozoyensis (strain ATCC 20868 / MF5171) TaxID=1116229 RepID=S3E6Z8_GLAL2|nr:NAD(P)-binding Rossmann-fold containing protein [Glarea lozoyensis ATCC 20868]EPE34133.1 NAD(P)-binding Rossmann-fold containing protein [Glarea lozoyensis ATCC 20868]